MTDYFRRHLGAKLLLSYLAIIVVGVTVLIVASQFILPTSFNRHMAGMMRLTNSGVMGMGGQGFGGSDPSRLSILDALHTGALTVGEIVEATGLTQSNVSNHLACLRDCGLVIAEQQGRQLVRLFVSYY